MLIKTRTNVYDVNFHLVWVTKYRKPMFETDLLREDMKKHSMYISAR
jgi:putative transposase